MYDLIHQFIQYSMKHVTLVCMPKMWRYLDHTNAAGGVMQEIAICYLQILLSDHIDGFHRTLHMTDVDDGGIALD